MGLISFLKAAAARASPAMPPLAALQERWSVSFVVVGPRLKAIDPSGRQEQAFRLPALSYKSGDQQSWLKLLTGSLCDCGSRIQIERILDTMITPFSGDASSKTPYNFSIGVIGPIQS